MGHPRAFTIFVQEEGSMNHNKVESAYLTLGPQIKKGNLNHKKFKSHESRSNDLTICASEKDNMKQFVLSLRHG